MKASELIEELENAIAEHGDLPVFYYYDDAQGELSPSAISVELAGNEMNFASQFVDVPKRLILG